MRKISLALQLALAALLLFWWVNRESEESAAVAQKPTLVMEQVHYGQFDVHRKHRREPLFINAARASYQQDSDRAELADLTLRQGAYQISAEEGSYDRGQLALHKNIVARHGPFTLTGDVLYYDPAKKLVTLPQGLLVRHPQGWFSAAAGTWQEDKFSFTGQVRTFYANNK